MKKFTRNIIIGSLIAIPLIGFIYHKQSENIFQDKNEQLFDNSLPGKWNVTTTMKTSDGNEPRRQDSQACITKELISASMNKPLQSKLGFDGLNCKTTFKKVSEIKGEFTLNCSGENPANKHTINVVSKGVIITESDKSMLDVENVVSSQGDKVNVNITTESVRLGDCK
jgi:hypothetical protein